jgi:hypothetical protein
MAEREGLREGDDLTSLSEPKAREHSSALFISVKWQLETNHPVFLEIIGLYRPTIPQGD